MGKRTKKLSTLILTSALACSTAVTPAWAAGLSKKLISEFEAQFPFVVTRENRAALSRSVSSVLDYKRNTIMHYLSKANNIQGINNLLASLKGKDKSLINARNGYGETPLCIAAQEGHEAVVSLLLENGANVNAVNNYGETPLWIAAANGREAVVSLLLAADGVNVNAVNNYGETPLMLAVFKGSETVVRSLLENGADVNLARNTGETPLEIAVENGHGAIVRLLKGTYEVELFIKAHRAEVTQADLTDNKCALCYESFQEKGLNAENVFKLRECECKVFMCLDCAKEWLANTFLEDNEVKCPLCRKRIPRR